MKRIGLFIIIAVVFIITAFLYITNVSSDGVENKINGLDGYWRQQILIKYTDESQEYLGGSIGDKLTLTRDGKQISDISYVVSAKINPSDTIENIYFNIEALQIELYNDGLSDIHFISQSSIINTIIPDDGEWHILAKEPLNIYEVENNQIRVDTFGTILYCADNGPWVETNNPKTFTFEVSCKIETPDDPSGGTTPETPDDVDDIEVEIIEFYAIINSDDQVYVYWKVKNNGDNNYWCWRITNLDTGQEWMGVRLWSVDDSKWCKIYPITVSQWHGFLEVGVASYVGEDPSGGTIWDKTYTDSKEFYASKTV